jgi:hypothetical protein
VETLTDEQRAYWDEVGWARRVPSANKGQTAEQALAFSIHSIRYAFSLEGLPVPSEEAVAGELGAAPPRPTL